MVTRILTSLVLSLPLIGAYGIFALGIVLIYRASRMLNLAHGAMAMIPAFAIYALVGLGIPMPIALVLAVALGAVLGVGVERLFVSRLRGDGATAQTVGTVAALGVLVALAGRIWGTSARQPVAIFPEGRVSVGFSSIQYGEIGLFIVMLVVAGVLLVLLQRTDLGLMMRGTAESRLAASLMGVNPSLITGFTWALGGALAALAGILLAAVTSLQPFTLSLQVLPAFIAALIGGLGSLPGALVGAIIVGATQGLVPAFGSVQNIQGAPQLFLAVLAIVVMAARGKAIVGVEEGASEVAPGVAQDGDEGVRPYDARRHQRRYVLGLLAVMGVMAVAFTDIVPSSMIGSANLAAAYATVAISITMLTGWVGQISLGHAALVGIGAFFTGHVVGAWGIPFPVNLPIVALVTGSAAALLGVVALRVRGLYLAVATLVFSWMASEFLFRQDWFIQHASIPATVIGTEGSVPFFDFGERRTVFLASWAIVALVAFAAGNMRSSKTGRAFFAVRGSEIAAASLGIDVMRFKLLAFALSGAIAGIGGTLLMVDARVVTSDQFTFNISLFYLALAVVGGMSSLGGAVASGVFFGALTELFFRVESLGRSLEIVSSLLLAVVLLAYPGGLASVPGQLRRGVERLTPRVRRLVQAEPSSSEAMVVPAVPGDPSPEEALAGDGEVEDTTDSTARPVGGGLRASLAGVLGGIASAIRSLASTSRSRGHDGRANAKGPLDLREVLSASPDDVQPAADGTLQQRTSEAETAREEGRRQAIRVHLMAVKPEGPREDRAPIIVAQNITVRFGGLTAVNDASLQVREGEIVGLIGPNGAGKTTLFNAIAGLNSPAAGTIHLFGEDATRLGVHQRARLGVARTFQALQLFGQLTVYDNLLVATHVHNPTHTAQHIGVTRRALEEEVTARERVDQVVELLRLEDTVHRTTSDLPFGVLRMVEVARALVTGFPLIMLDEPASGLDNTETDALTEVLRLVRGLGVTLLLIEHDVRMVTSVSDYMYVLERGRMIAEGTPDDVKRDPAVIAAYLGMEEGSEEDSDEPALEQVAG